MPNRHVEGVSFNTEDLSDEQSSVLGDIDSLELLIADVKNEISVLKDAQNFYSNRLEKSLKNVRK